MTKYFKERHWHNAVLKKDNYKCIRCGSTQFLETHHKKYRAYAPDLQYEVANGSTLCIHCHNKEHNGYVLQKTEESINYLEPLLKTNNFRLWNKLNTKHINDLKRFNITNELEQKYLWMRLLNKHIKKIPLKLPKINTPIKIITQDLLKRGYILIDIKPMRSDWIIKVTCPRKHICEGSYSYFKTGACFCSECNKLNIELLENIKKNQPVKTIRAIRRRNGHETILKE